MQRKLSSSGLGSPGATQEIRTKIPVKLRFQRSTATRANIPARGSLDVEALGTDVSGVAAIYTEKHISIGHGEVMTGPKPGTGQRLLYLLEPDTRTSAFQTQGRIFDQLIS